MTQIQQQNTSFGGDLLGFGSISTPTTQPVKQVQPQVNNLGFGADLMGFGISSPQPVAPVSQPVNLGFDFGAPSTPVVPQPVQAQVQNNFGINLLGGTQQVPVSVPQPTLPQGSNGFKPIINTNPNKFLAYENQHLQIWMDCIK